MYDQWSCENALNFISMVHLGDLIVAIIDQIKLEMKY